MAISSTEVTFLQRLLEDRAPRRPLGVASRALSVSYGIGVVYGRRVEYVDADYERARSLLQRHDLPLARLGAGASRTEAAAYSGMSEKAQSRAPTADSLCMRFIGNCRLDGHALYAPPGGYLVLPRDAALQVEAQELLVVENLETFRMLDSYAWAIQAMGGGEKPVLVLYRGDRDRSIGEMSDFIAERREPSAVFYDFDPAGLGMASSVSRLSRVIAPDRAWLTNRLVGTRGAELFAASKTQWEGVLDNCRIAPISEAWELMKSKQAGMAQEGMTGAPSAWA